MKLLVSVLTLSAVLVAAAVAERGNRLSADTPEFLPETVERSDRARATFGEDNVPVPVEPVVEPEPEPEPEPQEETPRPVAESPKKEVPGDIAGFLERWRATFTPATVQEHAETYAPRMQRFFNKANVSRDSVMAEKQRIFRIYPDVNKYEIHDIRLESLNGDRAVVTLRKDWDLSGVRRYAGSESQRLGLRKLSQGWQIVHEEELKVHWVRK